MQKPARNKNTSTTATPEAEKALDRMRRLCSRREYCTTDIRHKLLTTQLPQTALEEIITTLVKEGFLSDLRYCTAFARDKAALTGWGELKIRHALSAKGIDAETIDTALQEIDPLRASEKMEKIIASKYKSLLSAASHGSACRSSASTDDAETLYTLKMKLLRFAVGRGYPYSAASDYIDRLLSSPD